MDYNCDVEKAKEYALQQADWIAHRNGDFLLKDCVFFYHKGRVVYDPWHNENGDANENPAGFYGKDKMEEFCRRIIAKNEGSSSEPSSVVVDSKILDFLKMLYFGITDNPIETASRSAYTDMCRTIRFKGKNGDVIRKAVDNLLVEKILELVAIRSSVEFTQWHHAVCMEIVDMYISEGIEFYVGQAQKWVNMALKYLYVLNPDVVEPYYCYLHIPLDNYIMDIAWKQYGVPLLSCAWSRISNYQDYLAYEETLMEVIDTIPLDWEFSKWLESAGKHKSRKRKMNIG